MQSPIASIVWPLIDLTYRHFRNYFEWEQLLLNHLRICSQFTSTHSWFRSHINSFTHSFIPDMLLILDTQRAWNVITLIKTSKFSLLKSLKETETLFSLFQYELFFLFNLLLFNRFALLRIIFNLHFNLLLPPQILLPSLLRIGLISFQHRLPYISIKVSKRLILS